MKTILFIIILIGGAIGIMKLGFIVAGQTTIISQSKFLIVILLLCTFAFLVWALSDLKE